MYSQIKSNKPTNNRKENGKMHSQIKKVLGATPSRSWLRCLLALVAALSFASGATSATLPVTSGLQLWLQADSGVTTNADGVTIWADQSGNGHDATQSGAAEPQLVLNAVGKPLVQFDGVSDWLGMTPFAMAPTSSIFIAYYAVPTAHYQGLLFNDGSAPTPYAEMAGVTGPTMWPWGGGYATSLSGTNVVEFGYANYSGGSAGFIGVNGVTVTNLPWSGAADLANWVQISGANYGQGLDGGIAGILIYDRALDSAETASVVNYMGALTTPPIIPEPSIMTLMAFGLLMQCWRRTSQRRGSRTHSTGTPGT